MNINKIARELQQIAKLIEHGTRISAENKNIGKAEDAITAEMERIKDILTKNEKESFLSAKDLKSLNEYRSGLFPAEDSFRSSKKNSFRAFSNIYNYLQKILHSQ